MYKPWWQEAWDKRFCSVVVGVDLDEMASLTEGEDVMLFPEDEAANEVLMDALE